MQKTHRWLGWLIIVPYVLHLSYILRSSPSKPIQWLYAPAQSRTLSEEPEEPEEPKDLFKELVELTRVNYTGVCLTPRKLFTNRITSAAEAYPSNPSIRIPRILHFSYRSSCLPQDIEAFVQLWSEALPNHSIMFHDDDAVERLLNEDWPEFPLLRPVRICILSKGAMLVDLWRLLVIYKYGGIYSDIDQVPLELLTPNFFDDLDVDAFSFRDGWNRPTQYFFAMSPKHPVLCSIVMRVLKNVYDLESIRSPKVVFVTGPHAFKSGLQEWSLDKDPFSTASSLVISGPLNKTFRLDGRREQGLGTGYMLQEMVPHPYNVTVNITRRHRIEMEGEVIHWSKRADVKKLFGGSCRDFLRLHVRI